MPWGVPLTVLAEVAEVFMATQAQGVNCAFSNGEALSHVLPTVLYPKQRWRFAVGSSWLNSTTPTRPDWVSNTNRIYLGVATLERRSRDRDGGVADLSQCGKTSSDQNPHLSR
jgi:hypothetical protein